MKKHSEGKFREWREYRHERTIAGPPHITICEVSEVIVSLLMAAGKTVLGVVYSPPNLSKVDSIPI